MTVDALAVGDAVEWDLIVSNDGWEWVSGVVEAVDPLTVRFWDGDAKTLRSGANPPKLRVPRGSHQERRTPARKAGEWQRVDDRSDPDLLADALSTPGQQGDKR